MNSDPRPVRKSPFKNPLLYSGLLVLVVAAFVFYTMLDRYLFQARFEERQARELAARRLADDRLAIQQLGGSELAIRGLYVSPAVIRTGQAAQLCYDVANAKAVTLDPPLAEVWPSHSRCIELKLKKSTTFTLTIANASGKIVSQSVDLKVM